MQLELNAKTAFIAVLLVFGLLLEALKLWPTMTHSPQVLEESALTSQPYSVSNAKFTK